MERLEKIVRQMNNNELDIDIFERENKKPMKLLPFCTEKLTKADREVEKLLQERRSWRIQKLFCVFKAIK